MLWLVGSSAMKEEEIAFCNAAGETLSGVLHHPPGVPNGAVILCHGMESNKNSEKLIVLGRKLAEAGVLALRFDFACAGESTGKFQDITYSGEVEDLKAAFSFVRERQAGKMALFGSSMGGTVAVLFAAQEPGVAAVVALAAPVHPEKFPRRILSAAQLQDWRDQGFTLYNGQRLNVSLLEDLERLDVPRSARNVKCPVLILHGDADEVVPVSEAYELRDALAGKKQLSILNGSDHRISDPILMQRAVGEALDWFLTHVR